MRHLLLTLMLLALAVIVVNGVVRMTGRALFEPPAAPAGSSFPIEGAQGYATSFMTTYFAWSPDTTDQREEILAAFFPDGDLDSDHVGDPLGTQAVQAAIPSGVKVTSDEQALFHFDLYLNYTVRDDEASQDDQVVEVATTSRVCADVTVHATTVDGQERFAILQRPSMVSCTPAAGVSVPPRIENAEPDTDAAREMEGNLETFFTAYGQDDRETLTAHTRGEKILRGTDTRLEFTHLGGVDAYTTDDARRRIAFVRVGWQLPGGGEVESDYRLQMYLNDQDRWIVEDISTDVPDSDFAPSRGGVSDSTYEPSAVTEQ